MLKIAVIGVGRMGFVHAKNIAKGHLLNCKLTAICDISSEVIDKCKNHFNNVVCYQDYREMLANELLDGVIIATPHTSHEEIGVYCIEHGVNTLIEKPLSITTKGCKHLIDVAKSNPDVITGVSYNQRSNRMYVKAKKMIASGELGNICRVNFIITDWYRSQAYYDQGGWRASYSGEGGGCLMNQCVHQLDILTYLIGLPKSIIAKTRAVNRKMTVENDVSALLDYGDFDCMFTASTHELAGINRLEIVGDKGRIIIGSTKMEIYKHKSEIIVNSETTNGYGGAKFTKKSYSYGLIRRITDLIYGQQLRSLQAFADAISKKGNVLASIEEGLNALEIINGIYLSSFKGEEVILPLNDEDYCSFLEERIIDEKKKKENK